MTSSAAAAALVLALGMYARATDAPAPWRTTSDGSGAAQLVYVERDTPGSARVRLVPRVLAVTADDVTLLVPSHLDARWPVVTRTSAELSTPARSLTTTTQSIALSGLPDLVFGCASDVVGATFVDDSLVHLSSAPPSAANDATQCARRVDVRAPCAADDDAPNDVAVARHSAQLARLTAQFSRTGPGIVISAQPAPGRAQLFLVQHVLAAGPCACGDGIAQVLESRVVPLAMPQLSGPTTLWISVPTFASAMYELVVADSADDIDVDAVHDVSFTDAFSCAAAEDPSVMRVCSAPQWCDCEC